MFGSLLPVSASTEMMVLNGFHACHTLLVALQGFMVEFLKTVFVGDLGFLICFV